MIHGYDVSEVRRPVSLHRRFQALDADVIVVIVEAQRKEALSQIATHTFDRIELGTIGRQRHEHVGNRRRRALMLNRPGRPRDQIGGDVVSGSPDLEAYGQMVLANPDFVGRLKTDAPMNEAYRSTFFGGTARGYTDYPALAAAS
jgi:2,4-dienoyl-CoA reductase-like NADH-dependent reductase (Old Yellow Enzyme family)